MLSKGRQAVFVGIHSKTGKPYQWPQKLVPYNELPVRSVQDVMDLLVALKEVLPDAEPIFTGRRRRRAGRRSRVAEVLRGAASRSLENAPNTAENVPDRDAYFKRLCAIKGASAGYPERGLEIAVKDCVDSDWTNENGNGNDPAEVEADWRSIHNPRLGYGWLCWKAEKASGGKFSRANQWFDENTYNDNAATAAAADDSDWTDPADIFGDADPGELGTPPEGSLPPILERMARDEANRKGTSIAFAAASGLGAICGVIGGSLHILVRAGWVEPGVLWLSLLARPGSAKTPIINAMIAAVRRIDAEWRHQDRPKVMVWAATPKNTRGEKPRERRITIDNVDE